MPELWGGVECTVNRVGDRYFDQITRTGHADRPDDLERIAALGISAIRYPVLWERVAPDGVTSARWEWSDARLHDLSRLGVRPIVGLVHHGSGPPHTNLADPAFADGLADYAGAVARRYPWVDEWTPVNEPLTTARFSGLYGHWYPHGHSEPTFLRILVNQCRAMVLAMRAVRRVNPSARFVHTEDAGHTYATRSLLYQAEFENLRRFLGLDLLFGRVTRRHPLWRHLTSNGVHERELTWFAAADGAPDVIGINYYLTSDRLLDRALRRYPSWSHGGNGRHRYADVAAPHAHRPRVTGFATLLERFWKRYDTPVAITEVHAGCTREEQLRWLAEAWRDSRQLEQRGVPVRAVTVWSLLGAYDWNKLVTQQNGYYEPGAFDVRGPVPRPTALATMARALARDGRYEHPLLETPGWWRRRTTDAASKRGARTASGAATRRTSTRGLRRTGRARPRRVLILGATGTLGRAFARHCEARGIDYRALGRAEVDITRSADVERVVGEMEPWAVLNATGYVRVDDAERDRERCHDVNATGAVVVAQACERVQAKLVTFSSDLVFDGAQAKPYVESDPVAPLNVYGSSKVQAERGVSDVLPTALVVRTSAFFGPEDAHNFVTVTLRRLEQREPVRASTAVVSPTYVPDLVDATLDLLVDDAAGVWHLSNRGEVSWAELARRSAELASMDESLVEACSPGELGLVAARPVYSALGSERGSLLPSLDDSLGRYFEARRG